MRRILLFAVLLTAISFVSCSSDDNETDKPSFVWGGDWNDPNDPNYKPEGYNPILGEWRALDNFDIKFIYTNEFKFVRTIQENDDWIASNPASYQINDKQYRIKNLSGQWVAYYYRIELEGQHYYLYSRRAIPLTGTTNEWQKDLKVK